MYSALWRILPGSRWVKVIELVALALVVLSVCVEWVFPWVAETFIQSEATVGQ
jgi:hypothetical protein